MPANVIKCHHNLSPFDRYDRDKPEKKFLGDENLDKVKSFFLISRGLRLSCLSFLGSEV